MRTIERDGSMSGAPVLLASSEAEVGLEVTPAAIGPDAA
jgi:hypothetical protein